MTIVMTPLDLYEYTNSELEEMGLPIPHDCWRIRLEIGSYDEVFYVCEDCGDSGLRTGVDRW